MRRLDQSDQIDYFASVREEYSVYEAKAKLSEILRRVKARREVTITDRGRKVARVVPYEEESPNLERRLEMLRDRGVIQTARLRPKDAVKRLDVKAKPGALKRFLKERD